MYHSNSSFSQIRATSWSVAAFVKAEKVEQPNVKPLSAGQSRELLVGARDDTLGPLYAVALATGLRQGELLGLRWSDVNLTDRVLSVNVTLQRVDKKFRLLEPKTRQSRRKLKLSQTAVEALQRQHVLQAKMGLAMGAAWDNALDLVFTRESGEPLEGTSITKRLKRLQVRLGLPATRFHDLRHTYATLQLEHGESLFGVKEALGHASIAITANVYAHITPAMQQGAADRIDQALGRKLAAG